MIFIKRRQVLCWGRQAYPAHVYPYPARCPNDVPSRSAFAYRPAAFCHSDVSAILVRIKDRQIRPTFGSPRCLAPSDLLATKKAAALCVLGPPRIEARKRVVFRIFRTFVHTTASVCGERSSTLRAQRSWGVVNFSPAASRPSVDPLGSIAP